MLNRDKLLSHEILVRSDRSQYCTGLGCPVFGSISVRHGLSIVVVAGDVTTCDETEQNATATNKKHISSIFVFTYEDRSHLIVKMESSTSMHADRIL